MVPKELGSLWCLRAAASTAAKRAGEGGVGPGIGVYCQVVYERPKPKGTTGVPV